MAGLASATTAPPARGKTLPWIALIFLFVFVDVILLRLFASGTGADWAPLWSAGKLAQSDPLRVYDFDLITAMQWSLFEPKSLRPFVYPPSALLLLAPLSLLPFLVSYAVFAAGSAAILARSAFGGSSALLLLLAPPVVFAGLAGQPTLLVAALAVTGCIWLRRNEAGAGVLFGLAAMLKPPLLLLAPIGMVAGRHWRALSWSAATALSLFMISLLLFGFQTWMAWLDALPRFHDLFAGFEPLLRNAATPYAFFMRGGFDPSWVPFLAAAIAVPFVILMFACTDDPPLRSVAMLGGALLITPYAMHYELAVLAPAVAAMRLRNPVDAVVPAVWSVSWLANASVIGLLAIYAWALVGLIRLSRSAGNDRAVQDGVHVPA